MNNRMKRRLVSHGQLNKTIAQQNNLLANSISLVSGEIGSIIYKNTNGISSHTINVGNQASFAVSINQKGDFNTNYNTYRWKLTIAPTYILNTDLFELYFSYSNPFLHSGSPYAIPLIPNVDNKYNVIDIEFEISSNGINGWHFIYYINGVRCGAQLNYNDSVFDVTKFNQSDFIITVKNSGNRQNIFTEVYSMLTFEKALQSTI